MPSAIVEQHSLGKGSAACSSDGASSAGLRDEATPASRQQPCSMGPLGLPVYSTAGQQSMPWTAGSDQLQQYASPQFHEMEV